MLLGGCGIFVVGAIALLCWDKHDPSRKPLGDIWGVIAILGFCWAGLSLFILPSAAEGRVTAPTVIYGVGSLVIVAGGIIFLAKVIDYVSKWLRRKPTAYTEPSTQPAAISRREDTTPGSASPAASIELPLGDAAREARNHPDRPKGDGPTEAAEKS